MPYICGLAARVAEAVFHSPQKVIGMKTETSVPEEQVSAPIAEATQTSTPVEASVASEPEPAVQAPEAAPVEDRAAVPAEPEAPAAASAERTSQPEPETPVAAAADAAPTAGGDEAVQSEPVDFSDEEASLAAAAPEFDLGDDDEHDEAQDNESAGTPQADYSGMTKAGLVAAFRALLAEKPVQTLRRDAEAIKVAFYKLHRAEVDQQRKAFLATGAAPEEFVPVADPAEQQLKEAFAEYRKKRDEFIATIESQKEENLKIKLRIIDELKELIDSGETLNHTFTQFRELQQRWKETGLVPQSQVKDIWETYNLYVENFYNFIKINKELRDLDLKKNYEVKLALCEEADALLLEPSVVNAFHKLQKLHEQWRETGPVANEYKEQLWERFRETSSKINRRHQEYFEKIKEEQKRNLELKSELCAKTEELAAAAHLTRKEWNKASDQLIEIQKVWKTIGFAPKKDNTKIYERFRTACDAFFEQKRKFYLEIKAEMEHNLQLKNEICAQAEALRDSDEWKKTTDELIDLQKRWKEIGPVSRRHADAVWKRFRAACDAFFARKAAHFSTVDAEHDQNLARKRELLAEIAAYEVADREQGFEAVKDFQRRWAEIGFVPIKQKDAINTEYRQLIDNLFATLRGSEKERRIERFRGKVTTIKEGGDRRLRYERDRLYNKVKQLEADIALLENNIGFFARSKNADAMIRDVQAKIERAKEEMATTIEKINILDAQGE